MRKLIVVTTFFVNFIIVTMAQNPVGKFSIRPMAGINISDFSNDPNKIYSSLFGVTGGVELEYGVNHWLGISSGLLYSQEGAKIDAVLVSTFTDGEDDYYSLTDIKGKVRSHYLNIPLMANFYIPAVKGLAFKAGVQLGILVDDKLTADLENVIGKDRKGATIWQYDGYPRFSKSKIAETDIVKSVDFGIPVGISYEYKNITLDTRYYFGLTKIDKSDDPENSRNRFLSICLGYRFQL